MVNHGMRQDGKPDHIMSAARNLVIATRNRHKAEEIRSILSQEFEYETLNNLPGAPELIEDADSFAGNATGKAVQLAEWLAGRPSAECEVRSETIFVLADDSGLEVDALAGAPGVHSARFAGLEDPTARGNSPDGANNAKLLRLLQGVPLEKRAARFRCVLALVEVTPHGATFTPHLFEGVCEGHISYSPSGQGGFGYDPLFVPTGYEQSFGELGEALKNRLSHRAKALAKLKEWLEKPLMG